MEYGIKELASMAGISTRTLRYYDEIGLLTPNYTNDAGYRFYGGNEVNRLQQIMFYRERELPLDMIKEILDRKDFDIDAALLEHLEALNEKRIHLDALISTLENTLLSRKGEYAMKDTEKFEAFKQRMVDENEAKYGDEIRDAYGDQTVDESNRKMLKMTEEEYHEFEALGKKLNSLLEEAVKKSASPEDEIGNEVFKLHKAWLSKTWNFYNTEAHRNLTDMYIADERFKKYYDTHTEGCAQFLRDAVWHWTK